MTNATVKEIMTNAKVEQVGDGGAPSSQITFNGAGAPGSPNCTGRAADAPGDPGTGCVGETEFEVPANVPAVAVLPGDASMLKPGAKVTVDTTDNPDGSVTAGRITISQ